MVIIKVQGGLGNQMFQYALYKQLEFMGKDVKLDIGTYNIIPAHQGYELEKLYMISALYASKMEIGKWADVKDDFLSRVRRKLCGRRTKSHLQDNHVGFNERVFDLDNLYLDGYWQSEKYFENITHIVRSTYTLDNFGGFQNEKLFADIGKNISVGVHIRRGDYVNHKLFDNICNIEYYTKGIDYFCSIFGKKNVTFIVFSNDQRWVQENIKLENAVYVNWNTSKKSYLDMQLMAKCEHNIIANSSFSWWGAWLNNNPQKIVISPSKWTNDPQINLKYIVPDDWIKI